ncbi:MAG: signal peptidase I [Leptospiraceae bacterium]|nr:signal peptidase I [Leptospiraceae bacterium]
MERYFKDFIKSVFSLGILILLVFAFKHSFLDANNIPSGSMIPTLKIGDYLFVNKMRFSLYFPFTYFELARIDEPQRGDIATFVPPRDPTKNYVKRIIGMPGDRIRIRNVSICDPELPIKRATKTLYQCNQEFERKQWIPVIAFVEYKERDQGEWRHFEIEEINYDEAEKILRDSDSIRVLYPDERGIKVGFLPVLFRENINGRIHYFIETSEVIFPDSMCEEIETEGCLIPENHYFLMGDNRDDSQDSRFWQVGTITRDRILGKPLVIYFSINWRDQLCFAYFEYLGGKGGFPIKDFPPEEQKKYCSFYDVHQYGEGIFGYLYRTIFYRIPRMEVRWYRIGTLLE